MRVVRIAPGPRTPHRHPHSVEVMYVVEGAGTTWEHDVPTPVGPGDVVVVPAGTPHVTLSAGPGELVLAASSRARTWPTTPSELDGPCAA